MVHTRSQFCCDVYPNSILRSIVYLLRSGSLCIFEAVLAHLEHALILPCVSKCFNSCVLCHLHCCLYSTILPYCRCTACLKSVRCTFFHQRLNTRAHLVCHRYPFQTAVYTVAVSASMFWIVFYGIVHLLDSKSGKVERTAQ